MAHQDQEEAGYAPPPPRSAGGQQKKEGLLASLPSATEVVDGYLGGLVVVGATALTVTIVIVAVEAVRGLVHGDDDKTPCPAPQGGETPPPQQG